MKEKQKYNEENVIGFDALYQSMMRCRKNVMWKDSVSSYYLNGIEQTLKLEKQLKGGSYKARTPVKFTLTHPKRRDAVSIAFRDRVYQRSLNDNELYQRMTRSFIYTNAACQKGKGTDLARDTLDKYLREHYRTHGISGYVLQCDIKGYYPNMDHATAEAAFRKKLPQEVYKRTESILREQYEGDTGYHPGSQMIQIAGISVLDPVDHYIKEKLRIQMYIRYMDDFLIIHPDKTYLEKCRNKINQKLKSLKFNLHPEKTKIIPIRNGILFLGFTHRITGTGKIIRMINPDNVKTERKKLKRMAGLVKKGKMTKEKVDQCFESWKAYASKGNSFHLIRRMDQYYRELWR